MSTANIPIPTRGPSMEHPDVTTKRRADALAEIQTLNSEHMLMADELAAAKRTISQLEDRIDLLVEDCKQAKREAKIYMRKTVELATVMTNIGLLSRKGEEVVMSAGELLSAESDEEAEQEQKSAASIVAQLPVANITPIARESVQDQVARDLGLASAGT